MSGVKFGASQGLRWGALGLVTAMTCIAISGDQAAARHRSRHIVRHHAHEHVARDSDSYSPPYSDIVVDANTGATLHATNPDAPRHPASLTKMMTLYLLFERLDESKMRLDTPIEMSPHAASMAPSKLGLRPGQTLTVDEAIKAVVTRSANDVAVAIGEAIAGDEAGFAEMMTRKAHALGMTHTEYHNACGLPNDLQITTARDQATLARALMDRFPRYFHYFSTPSFTFRGEVIRNHDHLLGRVEGVDGIKTGYIRASGFNLVTSMHRGDRRIVGVVFGGSSVASRDARMRDLVSEYIQVASARRTAPPVTEVADSAPPARARVVRTADAVPGGLENEAPYARVAPQPAPASAPAATPPVRPDPSPTAAIPSKRSPADSDPIRPVLVKTLTFKAGAMQTAALAALPSAQAAAPAASAAVPPATTVRAETPPPAPRPGTLGTLVVSAAPDVPESAAAAPSPAHARGGWLIQVGAFDSESEARLRLASAQSRAGSVLAGVDPYTERVVKGDKAMYRARFAGLDRERAEAACKSLKRSDIACMPLKN